MTQPLLVGRRSDLLVGGGPLWGLAQVSSARLLRHDPQRGLVKTREDVARAAFGGDPVFLQKVMWMSPDDLGWLSERCNTVYVLTDTVRPGVVERGRACRSSIVTGTEALEAFRAAGCRVRQMLQGFRPHVWRGPRTAPVVARVAFTGSLRPPRDRWLEALRKGGLEVDARQAYASAAASFYRRSAACLCPGPIGDEDSFSNRLVRTMAAGGLPLHWDVPSVRRLFPCVPTWKDAADLVSLARLYLGRPDARSGVIADCTEAVKPYRWDLVASRWLAFALGDDAVPHDGPA